MCLLIPLVSPRSVLGLGTLLGSLLAMPVAGQGATSSSVTSLTGAPADLIGVIQAFESEQDAKCQATATRLENFVAGTPLDDGARLAKIDLQKKLLAEVWGGASSAAEQSGVLDAEALAPFVSSVLRYQADGLGGWAVTLGDGELLALDGTEFRQYASVAYALRAILGLQQESLLDPTLRLMPASDEAIERLKELVDVHTLAVLELADREARLASRPTVDAAGLSRAWARLRPEPPGSAAIVERPNRTAEQVGVETAPAPSGTAPSSTAPAGTDLATFRPLVDAKLAAYASYNEVSKEDFRLLLQNIRRYYARFPVAPPPAAEALHRTFVVALRRYAAEVMRLAQDRAHEQERRLIRADDALAAVQLFSPHEIDEFEDALFFPRLPPIVQIRIEAYDMDSFRDFGTHWLVIKRVIDGPNNPLEIEPDPFAAEVFAEGIAQFGVLLYRLAGTSAATDGRSQYLTAEHIHTAFESLLRRAVRHRSAPPRAPESTTIQSATTSEAERDDAAVMDRVTEAVGLTFHHRSSDWLSRFRRTMTISPPTFSGGGVAAEDINGDGRADLLLVGGRGNRLFVATEAGSFDDVTVASGLDVRRPDGTYGEARQPLIADLDNDGHRDILITYAGDDHRLFRGLGGGRFEDASARAGLGGKDLIGGPATVFDFDRDGLLDIYIGYFGDYRQGALPNDGALIGGGNGGDPSLPTLTRDNKNALPNRLFRNLGALRFADVTESSGTGDTGWAQAIGHSDVDGDGWQDLVVANDFGKNAVLLNRGDGTFEDVAAGLGMDKAYHSMNVGFGDLNGDFLPEIYVSNINTLIKDARYVSPNESTMMNLDPKALANLQYNEASVLWTSRQDTDGGLAGYTASAAVERGENTVGWAWDADFFDLENDGDEDLYVANGTNEYFFYHSMYIQKRGEESRVTVLDWNKESNVLLVNEGGKLRNRSRGSGMDLLVNARAAAYFDLDTDGDLDVVLNNFHAPADVLRNRSERLGNRWLKLTLVGDPARGSNRDAIGARVAIITPDGRRQWREVHGSTGYLSAHPKTVHVGLGQAQQADIEIRWPNGDVEQRTGLEANQSWEIVQGTPQQADAAGEPDDRPDNS